MDSLMKRRHNPRATEALIKEALLCQLSNTVKEVQLLHSQTKEVFTSSEAVNSLIAVLEAIFLHGLKRGIWRSALKSMQGVQETKPQPSFWPMVRSYTHKHTVETIKGLSQITTDVARGRVWVRVALNEAELTSYLQAMEKDRRPIHSHYNNVAFLRDRDICDTAVKLLDGLISIEFRIPINSSILNSWSNEPLMLSGIWSPSMKTPLSTAVDVAEGIEDEDDDTCSIKTSSSVTTLSALLSFDETQALRMILDTPIKTLEKEINSVVVQPAQPVLPADPETIQEDIETENFTSEPSTSEVMGNSVARDSGWSSGGDDFKPTEPRPVPESTPQAISVPLPFREPKTYTSLLESYGTPPKNAIDYRDILKDTSKVSKDTEASEEEEGYEFLSDGNTQDLDNKLFKIVRELGLKAQNYNCSNCQLAIGLNFGEARCCNFTGQYYCNNCHINETSVIPSRLLFNWDHRKYPVCSQASGYINDIAHRPLIDIKQLNNRLYTVVSEMRDLRTLRFQLNMLRAYLFTCQQPVLLELQKRLWPREYLHDHIHLYSINDMQRIPGGELAAELSSIVTFARNHVIGCWLCSQKGFICEVCRNPKVIYPFDCDFTYRCSKCHSVYHEQCLKSNKNCPKCKRRESRSMLRQDSLESDS